MGLVCAIVLDYFGADKTERCLRSLAGQGIHEARVVDNSGDPEHQLSLSRHLRRLAPEMDFGIRYIANKKNLGFGRAINRALKQPAEEKPGHGLYLLINNDAWAEPGMVARLKQALHEHAGAAVVAPWTRAGNESFCGRWYQRHTGLVTKFHLPGSFHYLPGSCLLVNTDLLRDGLFDDAFFMYGEDVELGWRLQRSGLKPQCVAGAAVHHEGTGSSQMGGLFYEYHVARGHILLADKLATGQLDRLWLMLGRAIALPLRATVRCLHYRKLTPWRALMRAWWNDPPPA